MGKEAWDPQSCYRYLMNFCNSDPAESGASLYSTADDKGCDPAMHLTFLEIIA